MKKEELENVLSIGLSHKEDFSEVFEEKTQNRSFIMKDSCLEDIKTSESIGLGIRLAKNADKVYGCTNDLTNKNVLNLVITLNNSFTGAGEEKVSLPDLEKVSLNYESDHTYWTNQQKKSFLLKIDEMLRHKFPKIIQVEASINEEDSTVRISNNLNTYKEEHRLLTRLSIQVIAKDKQVTANHLMKFGAREGYKYLENIDLEKETNLIIETLKQKLLAKPCPGKKMPVIIGAGFGGVIFHEACGHALEATSIAPEVSVLKGKLDQKIASDKVTLIDDGTLDHIWGSTKIDDEGRLTQKNILIENGVLKSYLVDYLNSRKMHHKLTGSSRRESYKFAPTSRMNNTYLTKGNDKIEDMIKSITYGLYAKTMGGGQVSTTTGDFNFAVTEAYLIENGKITTPVKGASLIGNTKDILFQVEMVSDDLALDTGMCGSLSGYVPVTVGQPTIKIREILVGGAEV